MYIIKRNGEETEFSASKIVNAIWNANRDVEPKEKIDIETINQRIIPEIMGNVNTATHILSVEDIQDMVENALLDAGYFKLAKEYIIYRYIHKVKRLTNLDQTVLSLVEDKNEVLKQENSNKNTVIIPTQRDYIAGEVSKNITMKYLLDKDIVDAHNSGIIHFHDSDYFVQHIHNCCLVNLEDMLQNGTVISGTLIEKPHKFSTACNIATQCIAQIASSQYGGQSISLAHLAPFVEETRKTLRKKHPDYPENIIEDLVRDDITAGVQTIQYQVVTLMTTNGQAPFITLYMNIAEARNKREELDLAIIIEEVLKQRIQGVKNDKGVYITPAFPKLIYALDELNITEDAPYYYLTKLSAECTAKRMVPDYISNKIEREIKNGDVFPCMGCRSFLSVSEDHKYYGRFNQGVVTLNLVDVALSSGGDMDKFWIILQERTQLCYRALMARHNRLLGTKSDVAPILWQHGALARLKPGETIDELLYNGYSTISLGYAGLYECTKYMTGHSHTGDGCDFAKDVMRYLNDCCDIWAAQTKIGFSVYGTPLESTTYKFAKCLQDRFGVIPGITDKNYITNSYHVNVKEKINAFDKLAFESNFQVLSPGGAVSYVEVPDMTDNLDAVMELIKFIYGHIMYAELNTKSDYCHECGFDGEIKIDNDKGKLIWRCPNCGNTDQSKMSVARRTCGYIGTWFWNQGRTQEIQDRALHL